MSITTVSPGEISDSKLTFSTLRLGWDPSASLAAATVPKVYVAGMNAEGVGDSVGEGSGDADAVKEQLGECDEEGEVVGEGDDVTLSEATLVRPCKGRSRGFSGESMNGMSPTTPRITRVAATAAATRALLNRSRRSKLD